MRLENIAKRTNRTMDSKRLGRGYGSGVGGHTVGRGQKGQKSRSGHKSMKTFEGGNTPFHRRIPKYRGFTNSNKVVSQPISLKVLSENFNDGDEVSLETLQAKGLVRKKIEDVKILGNGELKKKLVVKGLAVSEAAKNSILEAKGKVE